MIRVFHEFSTRVWKTLRDGLGEPPGVWWGLVLVVTASFALLAFQAVRREGFAMGDPVEYANEAYRIAHGAPAETWAMRPKRSGFVALLYAAPLELAFAAGVAPERRLLAMQLAAALFGAATVLVTCLIAAGLAGRGAGLAAGTLLATNALFNAHASATFAEVPCAFFAALALWLVLCRSAPGAAGLAAGAAVLCRYQALITLPFLAVWMIAYRPRREAAAFAGGVLAALAALGAVDLVRHGAAFASFTAFLGFESAVLARETAAGAASPWYAYLRHAHGWLELTGPLLVAVALVRVPAAIGRERFLALALPALGMIAALSAIPHKELRFAVPVLPALCVLGALAPARRGLGLVALVALALAPACGLKRVLDQDWRAYYAGQRDAVRTAAARAPGAVVLTPTWSLALAEHADGPRIVNVRPTEPATLAASPLATHLVVSRDDLATPGMEPSVRSAGFRLVAWYRDAGPPYALFER